MRVQVPGTNGSTMIDCKLVEEENNKRRYEARCRIPCAGFSFSRVGVEPSIYREGGAPGGGEANMSEKPQLKGFVYLEGFASSSSVDWHGTEMSSRALANMETQFKNGVPYVPSHRDDEWDQVFGRTVDAKVVSGEVRHDGDISAPNSGLLLNVRVALDAQDERTKKLVRSLEIGNTVGMSIGGWFTEMEVITNDDDEVERMIIHAVELDHLATTRRPSNPDTWITEMHRSVQAAVKDASEVHGRKYHEEDERMDHGDEDERMDHGDEDERMDHGDEDERMDHVDGNADPMAEDFEPHMMYHPKTGEGVMAETYEDHLRLAELGYVHEKPQEGAFDDMPGDEEEKGKKYFYSRSATEYANLPIAPKEMLLNPDGASEKDIRKHILDMFTTEEGPGWDALRKSNLYFDESKPEELDSYHFLIARPYDPDDPENAMSETGDLYVFCDAVEQALEDLKSGPNIPEEDATAAIEHADMYMEKFEAEDESEPSEEMGGGYKEDKRAIAPYADLDFHEPMEASWSFDLKAQDDLLYSGRSEGNPNWERYAKAHVYMDKGNMDKKGGYKLPIAKYIDGELKVFWKAIVSAMGAVNGARGGVDISDSERMEAYKLLSKYYEKADKEPPEFQRCVILNETVTSDLDKTIKTGESSQSVVDAQRGARGIPTIIRPEGHSMSDHNPSDAAVPAEEEKVTLEAIARSLMAQTELLKAVVASSQQAGETRSTPEVAPAVEDEKSLMRAQITELEERVAKLAAAPNRVGRAKRLAPHHLDRSTGTYGSLVRSAGETMSGTAIHAVCKAQADRRDASKKEVPDRGQLLEDLRAVLGAAFADGIITDPDTRAGWR